MNQAECQFEFTSQVNLQWTLISGQQTNYKLPESPMTTKNFGQVSESQVCQKNLPIFRFKDVCQKKAKNR